VNITGEIRYWLGSGNYAQMKFSESKTSFSIDIVLVPSAHRSGGIGTLMIERILLLADALGKDVFVSARPIGTSSKEALERLVDYYRRFGFRVADQGLTVVYMERRISEGGKGVASSSRLPEA